MEIKGNLLLELSAWGGKEWVEKVMSLFMIEIYIFQMYSFRFV